MRAFLLSIGGLGACGFVLGYDIVIDTMECYNYIQIGHACEFFLKHNMNFETYDL
jgi:hypothetical protein